MKEHSGGTPEVAYEIPISSWDTEAYPIAIDHFNFSELDKPEDFIVEAVKEGRDVGPILKSLVNRISGIEAASKVAILLCIIRESKKPRMVADQIAWATGMNLFEGASCEELASIYGVSKQAFVQGAHRICQRLQLKPCRNMRDDKARNKMRMRNYRRNE